jgi:hypothetical protein
MQPFALREYVSRRGWTIAMQVREVNSGSVRREARKAVDGGGTPPRDRHRAGLAPRSLSRSVTDLQATLQELGHLGVGFASSAT